MRNPIVDVVRAPQAHAVFLIFAAAALITRLIFWIYTDRVWEDALISLTPARNVWEGFGLTHHASEPRVHSFTSALGELVLIAGEAVRQGLAAMRVASLVSAIISIYFAYRIGLLLSFGPAAFSLVLGYLAVDHLQIFFGMSGMETQIATAVLLGCVFYYLSGQWLKLGLTCGLALICRPEFGLMLAPIGIAVLWRHREHLWTVIAGGVATAGPWLIFATAYFGSPIPNTIYAKQALTQGGFMAAGSDAVLLQLTETWRYLAPFKQYWAAYQAPAPDWVLKIVVAALLALSILGAIDACRRNRRMIVPLIGLVLFFVYRTTFTISPYYMWYMPPFVALIFLFAAAGVAGLATTKVREVAAPAAALLVFAYGAHFPFTLPLDRAVQTHIENGVRVPLGKELDRLMGPNDTAVMEPLGYTGWYARNKTIYDFPGLSSKVALRALQSNPGTGIPGVVRALMPTFLVLRPAEKADVERWLPEVAAQYRTVAELKAKEPFELQRWRLAYWKTDTHFTVWQRKN